MFIDTGIVYSLNLSARAYLARMVATVIEAHCEGKNTYWQERDSLLIEEGQRTLAPRERTIDLLKYLGVLYRVLFQDIHFARVARRS